MSSPTLASFQATDGTGLWELTSAGVRVNGELWRFTDHSSIVCVTNPGHVMHGSRVVEEEDDGFGDIAALAVLQSGGGLRNAALARWALGGPSVSVESTTVERPGTVQLSINGLARPRDRNCSLRYREDGRYVQADEVRRFADATRAAISEYRRKWA